MGDDAKDTQSPGLELRIWVTAPKHLCDCVQAWPCVNSEVKEVISIHRMADKVTQNSTLLLYFFLFIFICKNEKINTMKSFGRTGLVATDGE